MLLMRLFQVLEGDSIGVILCLFSSLFQMYCSMLLFCIMIIKKVMSSMFLFLKLVMGSVSRVGMWLMQNILIIRFYCILEVCFRKCWVLLFVVVRMGSSRKVQIGMKMEYMLYYLVYIRKYCMGRVMQKVVVMVVWLLCWVQVRFRNLCSVWNEIRKNSMIMLFLLNRKVMLMVFIMIYQVLMCEVRLLMMVCGVLWVMCYLSMVVMLEVSMSMFVMLMNNQFVGVKRVKKVFVFMCYFWVFGFCGLMVLRVVLGVWGWFCGCIWVVDLVGFDVCVVGIVVCFFVELGLVVC